MRHSDPDHVFDQLLVIDIQSGNRQALNLLAKRWHQRIYQFALKKVSDPEAANDIAQETWMAIQKGIQKLKDPAKFPSWALGITFRKSVDHIRYLQKKRKEKDQQLPTITEDKESEQQHDRQIQALRKAIRTLPKKQRQTLELFYLDNYNLQEIAAILKIPEGTVKSRLFKARDLLKTHLINQPTTK
ncbi:MAG: sigma-70 family RNA polymerase sigma factor [Bacteroidota bacterium]